MTLPVRQRMQVRVCSWTADRAFGPAVGRPCPTAQATHGDEVSATSKKASTVVVRRSWQRARRWKAFCQAPTPSTSRPGWTSPSPSAGVAPLVRLAPLTVSRGGHGEADGGRGSSASMARRPLARARLAPRARAIVDPCRANCSWAASIMEARGASAHSTPRVVPPAESLKVRRGMVVSRADVVLVRGWCRAPGRRVPQKGTPTRLRKSSVPAHASAPPILRDQRR